jgi:hypothetical protein
MMWPKERAKGSKLFIVKVDWKENKLSKLDYEMS